MRKLPAALTVLLTLAVAGVGVACDIDSDCGAGGTCIKREKRASGVCYGGDVRQRSTQPAPDPAFFDPLTTPTERPANACFVTEECPAGMDCVKTGVWGTCMAL